VTLTFDNGFNGEARPIPKYDTDYVRLSRYLKNDGNYWFQANFQTITKSEVVDILSRLGINPDNMLIIMHQHMMMDFGFTTPLQKLLMVEEAIGFKEYRENLFETQRKLTQVISEEESVSNLLKNAEQTLAYWKDEYDKFLQRKELLFKKSFLERELAWARLIKQEKIVEIWEGKIRRKHDELAKKEKEIEETKTKVKNLKESLTKLRYMQNKLYRSLLVLEKEKIGTEEIISTLDKTLNEIIDQEKDLLSNLEKKKLSLEEYKKDDQLKNLPEHKLFEISSLKKVHTELGNRSKQIQVLERRLKELQKKAQ